MRTGTAMIAYLVKEAAHNPPGLRLSTRDDEGRACDSCQYFRDKSGRSREGDGECGIGRKDVPVHRGFVCDARVGF
jgi:hypothetical protein